MAVARDTANDAVLTEVGRLLIDGDARFDGARVLGGDEHVEVEATWGIDQRTIPCLPPPGPNLRTNTHDRAQRARHPRADVAEAAEDVLAHCDLPGTSTDPTEAVNGRLEHLRSSTLGFRNHTNNIARPLLEAGGFRPLLHTQIG